MEFRYLGPLEVIGDGEPVAIGPPKQRALLAVLLLHANAVVSADAIIDAIWADAPPRSAGHSVHIYISNLRKALAACGADTALRTRASGYQLVVDPVSVDGLRFEAMVSEASAAIAEGSLAAGAGQLRAALDLWRGDPFSDVAYEEFVQSEIRHLRELRSSAFERLYAAELLLGRHHEAVPPLERLAADQPFNEELHRLLFLALYRSGRQADALRGFQALRRRLGDEAGLEPSPELELLEEQMLLRDPALNPEHEPPPAAFPSSTPKRNPYKGLRPFLEDDAVDFFGRDRLVEELLAGVARTHRLVSLVGPSGSGKSSVLFAGLLPRLRKGGIPGSDAWPIAVMMPGSHPFAALEEALLRVAPEPDPGINSLLEVGELGLLRALLRLFGAHGPDLLLVIDQFEELFLLTPGEEHIRFLRNLVVALEDPGCRLRVLIALRADFYDRPLGLLDFGRLFADGVVHLMPLSAGELEEAVVEPARQLGVAIEPPLLAELISDVTGNPAALPLFEYALTELYENRTGTAMTLSDYEALGGLERALSRRAEALCGELSDDGVKAARQLFLRLVTVTGEIPTRRRAPLGELLSIGVDPVAMQEVLDLFGRHRLIAFDRDPGTKLATVEVAHEALLREWERLRALIAGSRRDLHRYRALAADAEEWIQAARHPDYLLSGTRLDSCLAWSAETPIDLTTVERDYLAAGGERAELQTREETDRRRETRRDRRRLSAALGAMVALVALAGAYFGWVVVRPVPAPTRVGILFAREGVDDEAVRLAEAAVGRAVTQFGVEAVALASGGSGSDWALRTASHTLESGLMILDGPGPEEALAVIAPEFPAVTYVVVDGKLVGPNVMSVDFAEQQGAFLVGVAAALKTETGTVGFLGGRTVGFVDAARAGFEAGVRAVDPDIEVLVDYLWDEDIIGSAAPPGDRWAWYYAFNWPEGANLATTAMYRSGADIVYAAAGGSGIGVIEAAWENQVVGGTRLWAIGYWNDDYLTVREAWKPHVLTSTVKRIDMVAYDLIAAYEEGDLKAGSILRADLATDGVGYSTSGGFIDDIVPVLEDYKQKIITGEIVVPSWMPGRSLG